MRGAGLGAHFKAVLRGRQGVLAAASPGTEPCLGYSSRGSVGFWGQGLFAEN